MIVSLPMAVVYTEAKIIDSPTAMAVVTVEIDIVEAATIVAAVSIECDLVKVKPLPWQLMLQPCQQYQLVRQQLPF